MSTSPRTSLRVAGSPTRRRLAAVVVGVAAVAITVSTVNADDSADAPASCPAVSQWPSSQPEGPHWPSSQPNLIAWPSGHHESVVWPNDDQTLTSWPSGAQTSAVWPSGHPARTCR
jgi:hypothetical protein